MKWMLLLAGMMLVAMGYYGVHITHDRQEYVSLIGQVQALKKERNNITKQWTQLLIEEKTLADDSVINHAVRTTLNMHLPPAEQVVYLKNNK